MTRDRNPSLTNFCCVQGCFECGHEPTETSTKKNYCNAFIIVVLFVGAKQTTTETYDHHNTNASIFHDPLYICAFRSWHTIVDNISYFSQSSQDFFRIILNSNSLFCFSPSHSVSVCRAPSTRAEKKHEMACDENQNRSTTVRNKRTILDPFQTFHHQERR